MRSAFILGILLCTVGTVAESGADGRELAIRRLLGSGRYDEAFAHTRTIIETMPERSTFYALLAEAGQYAGRGSEADSILGACVRKGWGVGDAVAAMAWLDVHRARWLDAYTHFQTSIDYGGNSCRAYAGIQEMHEKLHGRDAAISHLLALTHADDRSGPVWYALALAYWSQWDLTKAQFASEQALRSGSRDARVQFLHLAIRCAVDPGRTNLDQVDRAYREALLREDWEGTAFLQWVRMNAFLTSGRADSAEASCHDGLVLAEDLGMLEWQGQFLLQSGRNAAGRGDMQEAIVATDSAAAHFRRAGAHDGILAAYALRLDLLLESFRYAEALDYCSRMLLQLDDRADPRLHAGAAIDAAWILSRIGGQRIAIVLGIHAESTLENMLYASHDRCRLNATLASIHASLGDTALAMRYGRTAMRFARSTMTDDELLSNCEGVLGDLELKRGAMRVARRHFARQWDLARRRQDPGEQRAAALAMAGTYDLRTNANAAEHWANIALHDALRSEDRHSEKECRLLRGRIAAARGDTAGALVEYERAFTCLDAVRRLRFLCSLTREMREWYIAQHAALADALIDIGGVREAAAVLARARGDVLSPLTTAMVGQDGATGRDLLALERARRATAALVHRSILGGSLVDAAHSDPVFGPLCTFFSHALPAFMRIDEVLGRERTRCDLRELAAGYPGPGIDPDEIAVDLLFGADHMKAICFTRDTIAFCRLPAGRAELVSLTRDIQKRQENDPRGGTAYAGWAAGMGMFEPLVDLVEVIAGQRQHLAIIGDGPHTMIPFEALTIDHGKGSRPLVDRFTVSYRPSLGRSLPPAWMPQADNGRVLMVGDVDVPLVVGGRPEDHEPGSPGAGQVSGIVQLLPGTIREMSIVEEHFGSRVDVLRGDAATDARFCASAPEYWIVHLATHGTARGPGRRSHVLYLSPSSGSNGEVDLEDILSLEMKGTLVVLPVCSSGQASLTDDVESMAHAFLEAGAASVLAARWSVDDELAVEFLSVFYGALSKGETKRMAVQTAMRAMIARGHHSYNVWAGFQLFGDGGALVPHDTAGTPGREKPWMILLGIGTVLSMVLGYLWRRRPRRLASHPDRERRD